MTVIDHDEVRRYLPHRYPFLLVDKIVAVEPGKTLTAIKNVTANEPFFNGHFPIKPIMPGVLMVEALAQASGILIYRTLDTYPTREDLFYLAGMDEVRFKRLVVPGDQLRLEVEVLKSRMTLWKFKGVASVDGEVACSAVFMNIRAPSVEIGEGDLQ